MVIRGCDLFLQRGNRVTTTSLALGTMARLFLGTSPSFFHDLGQECPHPPARLGSGSHPSRADFIHHPFSILTLLILLGSFLGCINLELILPQPYGHTSHHHHLSSSSQPERKLLTFLVYFYSSSLWNLASVPTIPPERLSCSSSVTLTAKPRGHFAAFTLHSLPAAFLVVDLSYL